MAKNFEIIFDLISSQVEKELTQIFLKYFTS